MAARATAKPKESELAEPSFEERIRQRAHEIYLQRAGQEGTDVEDWLQAEAELLAAHEDDV